MKILPKSALFKGKNPKTFKRSQEVGRKESGSQQRYSSLSKFSLPDIYSQKVCQNYHNHS
jgi:hypothetical protein